MNSNSIMSNYISNWWKLAEDVSKNSFRSLTLQAWKRCQDIGLDPCCLKYKFLSESKLVKKQIENKDLINVSREYIYYLSKLLSEIPHIIAISDKEGWVIDIYGEYEAFGGKEVGLATGASWAEENIGNNGIGTALHEEEPVLVYGIEHYASSYKSSVCFGIPIRKNNQIIGALDVSVVDKYASPQWISAAFAVVKLIETSLEISAVRDIEIRKKDGVLASDLNSFIISLLHEFRTPLTSIFSNLKIMDKSIQDISILEKNSFRILKLVNNFIDIFKIDNNCLQLNKQKINIISIIKELLNKVNKYIKEMNIEIYLESTTEKLVTSLDVYQIKRVILNILSNSIKASNQGDKIKIKISQEPDYINISIHDNGKGIPDNLKNKVFDEFYRIDDKLIRNHEGIGAGLYLVKKIIQLHKGHVSFAMEQSRGTTINIRLPITLSVESGAAHTNNSRTLDQVKIELSDIYS
ncbi:MAG: ATP-binding protein [Halanaerobiales bacterium]